MREKEIPQTPWEQANGNRRSQRQEKRLADEDGGKAQISSGRRWFSKRDVRLNGFLVEARTTTLKGYRIEREEFERLTKDAIGTPPGQLPAMQIDFDCEGISTISIFVMRLQDHLDRERELAFLRDQVKNG